MAIGYSEFRRRCLSRWRYALDDECLEMLAVLSATMEARRTALQADAVLYRAQLGCEYYEVPIPEADDSYLEPRPFDAQRMKPKSNEATEGRANPRGIPVLYLATDAPTAIAETRPYTDALVTLAEFALGRPLSVIDCTRHSKGIYINMDGDGTRSMPDEIWADIDWAFSQPVQNVESTAEYAPTQIIVEHIKRRGADGIIFKSALGPANNVVLFDPGVANPVFAEVHHVTCVSYSTERPSPHTWGRSARNRVSAEPSQGGISGDKSIRQ